MRRPCLRERGRAPVGRFPPRRREATAAERWNSRTATRSALPARARRYPLLAHCRIDFRCEARERLHVVDEQARGDGVLAGELARKTPGNAHVAEIVDDGAEDIPAWGR